MTATTPGVEVLKTDELGRVKTPAARREKLLDEFERSGLSGAKFAALAGIKYQTFAAWASRRRRQRGPVPGAAAEQMRWLEAVVAEAQQAGAPAPSPLKVHLPGGAWLELVHAQQIELAVAVVRALDKPTLAC